MLSARRLIISSTIFIFWKKTRLFFIQAPLSLHLLLLRHCQGHTQESFKNKQINMFKRHWSNIELGGIYLNALATFTENELLFLKSKLSFCHLQLGLSPVLLLEHWLSVVELRKDYPLRHCCPLLLGGSPSPGWSPASHFSRPQSSQKHLLAMTGTTSQEMLACIPWQTLDLLHQALCLWVLFTSGGQPKESLEPDMIHIFLKMPDPHLKSPDTSAKKTKYNSNTTMSLW